MAWKMNGKYQAYDGFKSLDIGYSDDIESVYKKCVELSVKHGVPLKEMTIEVDTDYDRPYWEIRFVRDATKEEIEEVDAQEARHAENRRKQFEAMKKEFE